MSKLGPKLDPVRWLIAPPISKDAYCKKCGELKWECKCGASKHERRAYPTQKIMIGKGAVE